MTILRKVIGLILLLVCELIEFADDKLGILTVEGWICGGKVIGTMILGLLGIFLFIYTMVALAWAIC